MSSAIVCSIHWLSNKLIASVERLCSETRPCYGVEEDMKKLKVMLMNIQAVLKNAEERAGRDDSVNLWLMELKNLLFVADDVFDEYEFDLLRHRVMRYNEAGESISSMQKKLKSAAYIDDDTVNENEYELAQSSLEYRATKETNSKRERDEELDNSNSGHKKLKVRPSDAKDMLEIYEHKELAAKTKERAASCKRKRVEEEKQVCGIASTFTKLSIRDGIADRVCDIVNKLIEITKHRHALQLREENRMRHSADSTWSYEDVLRVFGREFDKQKIIELLFSDCQKNMHIIPIVGMRGVGKTTLAQLVYNDQTVCEYFNLRGWVHMCESSDILQLIKAIIESFGKKPNDSTELSTLQDILKKEVMGKRVLLVLDNLSNQKARFSEFLLVPFNSAESLKIIVTSRDSSAEIKETIVPYRLRCLPEDQSWLLFQHCASDCQRIQRPKNLEEIDKKIVSKCKGLPLSLKMLGNLLRYETDEAKSIEILESDHWDEDESNLEIPAAIKLSYHHLPIYMKPCLTYCSFFPKGHTFSADKLVMLWMAQGFIQQKQSVQIEDLGCQYINELLRRSFFVKVDDHTEDDGQFFSIHDLIHDLIQSSEAQHLYIGGSTLFNNEQKTMNLRTFIVDDRSENCNGIPPILRDFNLLRNLRVLELKSSQLIEFPDSFGSLKRLRYLCLDYNQIKRLPETVCQLYNLQVLNLHHCVHLMELPKKIGNLINLLHLSCSGSQVQSLPQSVTQLQNLQTLNLLQCRSLAHLPKGIGNLTNLRHLKIEQLRLSRDTNQCGIAELKHLVNLSGKLCISGLKTVANMEDVKEANLCDKKQIKELRLDWHGYNDTDSSLQELDEGVLESLQPHTNLTKLEIFNYNGAKFPTWVADPTFSNLTSISLIQCLNEKCEFLPPLGQLPSLKSLDIQKIHGIRCIGRDFCCSSASSMSVFPSLVELKFCHLYGWEVWNEAMNGDFPVLKSLTIENCPILKELPTFPSLFSLNLWGLDQLQTIINLHGIVSLEHLTVKHCPELRLSPIADADQLPSGLVGSRNIEISGCPRLHEWCCRHGVLHWSGVQDDMIFESKFNGTLF